MITSKVRGGTYPFGAAGVHTAAAYRTDHRIDIDRKPQPDGEKHEQDSHQPTANPVGVWLCYSEVVPAHEHRVIARHMLEAPADQVRPKEQGA